MKTLTLMALFYTSLCYPSEIVWTINSHKSSSSIIHKNFETLIVNPVNKELAGKFKINFIPQGEHSKYTNVSLFSAVMYEKISGIFSATMYWGNIDPVFAIFGDLVAAWESTDDFEEWYIDTNANDILSNTYAKYNMKLLGHTLTGHESFVSVTKISNLNDIKGKVVRTPPGSMLNSFFEKAKVYKRPIPMAKVKMAFKRKYIDAADFSTIGENYEQGLYKIAKHTNYPGFHSLPLIDFVVSKKAWDSLPKKYQKVLNKYIKVWNKKNLQLLKAEDKKNIKLLKKSGVTIHKWSKESLKEARVIASTIWDDYAKKSKEASLLILSIKSWLKSKGKL